GGRVSRVVHVEQHRVVVAPLERRERRGGRADRRDAEALALEQQAQGLEDVRLVVGDEHGGGRAVRHAENLQDGSAPNESAATGHAGTGPSLPVIQPSRSSMIRLPNCAFASEWVTWMIVVPSLFNFLNNSMISRPWLECRLPVGSSARISLGFAITARA